VLHVAFWFVLGKNMPKKAGWQGFILDVIVAERGLFLVPSNTVSLPFVPASTSA
jgi:hypothetical protein